MQIIRIEFLTALPVAEMVIHIKSEQERESGSYLFDPITIAGN